MCLLQRVIGYLFISNFWKSWGMGVEDCYLKECRLLSRDNGVYIDLTLNIFISLYLNMEYSQVSFPDKVSVQETSLISIA